LAARPAISARNPVRSARICPSTNKGDSQRPNIDYKIGKNPKKSEKRQKNRIKKPEGRGI
jgi:hypothetical protein